MSTSLAALLPHLKSPAMLRLSWLPLSMYTAPPCALARRSRLRSIITDAAQGLHSCQRDAARWVAKSHKCYLWSNNASVCYDVYIFTMIFCTK